MAKSTTGDQKELIYSVTEITRLLKNLIRREFGYLWIEGEISNLRRPSSGHAYFTIKDENSQISAVMFKSDQTALKTDLEDGTVARVYGELGIYERSGQYQVVVRQVLAAGKGSLQAQFEALKEQLEKEGLFDPQRKRELPYLPRHIGVVTSPTGAAIRDILNVLTRRFPDIHILLAPAKVQGENAAAEIARAIEDLNRKGGLDVLIIGRGGGSIEDLWPFNEEPVARAISRSEIPVISAVGHETDYTISDFVADLRAPTPSAAAELVVDRKEDLQKHLAQMLRRLARTAREQLLIAKNKLANVKGSHAFAAPASIAARARDRIQHIALRMNHELQSRSVQTRQTLDAFSLRISNSTTSRCAAREQQLKSIRAHLAALSPLNVLKRGYSMARDSKGNVITSSDQVSTGDRIMTTLSEGQIESEITNIGEKQ